MVESLLSRALDQPRDKLFLDGEYTLKYGELIERIERLTTLLRECPVEPGGLVLVSIANPARFSEIMLSLLVNGFGAVVVNPGMAVSEFQNILQNTSPAALIVDHPLMSSFGLSSSGYESLVLFTIDVTKPERLISRLLGKRTADEDDHLTYPGNLAGVGRTAPEEPEDPTLAALVINTSGTTSDPKNVLVSRGACMNTLGSRATRYRVTEDSRILNVLPLYHGDGLYQGPLLSFYRGATWVRACNFSQQNLPVILDSIYGKRATHFIAAPVMLGLVLRLGDEYRDCFSTGDFKHLVSVSAALPEKLWLEFEAAFGVEIVNKYSLTECSEALYNGPDRDSRLVGALGKPSGCEIRIVNEDGNDVVGGRDGELWLRGKSLMEGYINKPEATAACMQDGWLRTGDLVRQDNEGFLFLTGRIKNMISFAGHTIVPEELAEALESHPVVSGAFVSGAQNREWGEIPIAFVTCEDDRGVTTEELMAHCRLRLSEYKLPREVIFVDEFIRTPTGKINAAAMLEQYRQQAGKGNGEIDDKVRAIAQACFRSSELPALEATPVTEPGWDSLAHMEMLLQIEKAFGIRFSAREIMMLESLSGIVELVRTKTRENIV